MRLDDDRRLGHLDRGRHIDEIPEDLARLRVGVAPVLVKNRIYSSRLNFAHHPHL